MHGAPLYNPRPREGTVWRVVGGAGSDALLKLVDDADELAILEDILAAVLPPPPPDGRHLPDLMTQPFRGPAWSGSRWRRAGGTFGIFYAAERPGPALAEAAFRRLLFYFECPGLPWPTRTLECTAFAVPYTTRRCLDLTLPPDDAALDVWIDPVDLSRCQELADLARDMGCEAIRSVSPRSPGEGHDVALLSCRAFAAPAPTAYRRWSMRLGASGVIAVADGGGRPIGFRREDFARDPRLRLARWERQGGL